MMLRNGKAAFVQLQVADLGAFTLPDTGASPTASNFTNVYARFGTLMLGSGSTAVVDTHTGLKTEIADDTKGLVRHTGSDVKSWLEDATGGEDAWKFHVETTWQVTAGQSQKIREFGFGNGSATPGNGVVALRQVFDEDFPLVGNDFFNLEVVVKLTGSFTQWADGTTAGGVVTYAGLREMCRNILSESTTRRGPDDDSGGDWIDGTGYSASWNNPAKFDQTALGTSSLQNDDATNGLARSDTTLTVEILNTTRDPTTGRNDLQRKTAANTTGSLKKDPDPVDPETFGADGFTVFAGDTVQWRGQYVSSGASLINVKEQGVFNSDNPPENRNGGTGTVDAQQVMLIRQIFADANPMRNTDEYTPVIRLQAL